MSSWSNIKFFKRTTNQILEVRVWGGANQLILPTESNEKSSWISEIVWIPTKFNVLAVWLQKPRKDECKKLESLGWRTKH